MACAIAVGFGELFEYLGAAAVAADVVEDIKSVCTSVTHAYNNGKKVIDTTTGYINTAKTTVREGKKQFNTLKQRSNKIRTVIKRGKVYKSPRKRKRVRRFK